MFSVRIFARLFCPLFEDSVRFLIKPNSAETHVYLQKINISAAQIRLNNCNNPARTAHFVQKCHLKIPRKVIDRIRREASANIDHLGDVTIPSLTHTQSIYWPQVYSERWRSDWNGLRCRAGIFSVKLFTSAPLWNYGSWFGIAVTALITSTKLSYMSSPLSTFGGSTHSGIHPGRPTQPGHPSVGLCKWVQATV